MWEGLGAAAGSAAALPAWPDDPIAGVRMVSVLARPGGPARLVFALPDGRTAAARGVAVAVPGRFPGGSRVVAAPLAGLLATVAGAGIPAPRGGVATGNADPVRAAGPGLVMVGDAVPGLAGGVGNPAAGSGVATASVATAVITCNVLRIICRSSNYPQRASRRVQTRSLRMTISPPINGREQPAPASRTFRRSRLWPHRSRQHDRSPSWRPTRYYP